MAKSPNHDELVVLCRGDSAAFVSWPCGSSFKFEFAFVGDEILPFRSAVSGACFGSVLAVLEKRKAN
jgi:hypothetical protein